MNCFVGFYTIIVLKEYLNIKNMSDIKDMTDITDRKKYYIEDELQIDTITINRKNTNYTREEMDEIIEEKLYETCTNMLVYIKQYSNENSIPLGEHIDYSSLYQFIVSE